MDAGASVLKFELAENMEFWTGGAFGFEGSLSETIVMVIVAALVILFCL